MTLQECIERWHERRADSPARPYRAAYAPATPEPVAERVAALTPRGHAAVGIIRLRRQLAALGDEDRAELLPLLADLVVAVAHDEPVPAS